MSEPPADSDDARSGAVRRLFTDLRHGGDIARTGGRAEAIEGGIYSGEAGSRERGTLVRVQLRAAPAPPAVWEMRYRAFGCPYTLAACEWLARELSGRRLGELSAEGLAEALGSAADWCQTLDIPAPRLGRLLIVEDALRAALRAARAGSAGGAGEGGLGSTAATPIALPGASDIP